MSPGSRIELVRLSGRSTTIGFEGVWKATGEEIARHFLRTQNVK